MTDKPQNTGPLKDVVVVDLTAMVSGPIATRMLADQGAEVIKVEPCTGETMRHISKPHNGINAFFFSCNRGKKSLPLNLKTAGGKEILTNLLKEADVFVQNFRPGAIDRMGFSEDAVRAINPAIIYTSISGFGKQGPYSHKRVYDPVIQALSGATDIQADRATGRPQMFRIILADKVTSLTAAQAITSALYAREKTGRGQHIGLSMLDAMISFFWPEGMPALTYADRPRRASKQDKSGSMDLVFETEEGYITAGAISDAEWAGLCRALQREDLIKDERFATASNRFINVEERKRIMATEIARWPLQEILERLEQEDVPCAPLLTRDELVNHAQIVANGTIERLNYEGFGEVLQARPAADFNQTPGGIQGPAPQLGEHTDEILERLGYNAQQRVSLVEENATYRFEGQ